MTSTLHNITTTASKSNLLDCTLYFIQKCWEKKGIMESGLIKYIIAVNK